jgi:DNA-binding transcriptional MerR regulator
VQAKQAAALSGVTVKALKYYEAIGLVEPARLANGYREFSAHDIDLIRQVKELTALGLSVKGTRPFIECLRQGHVHGERLPGIPGCISRRNPSTRRAGRTADCPPPNAPRAALFSSGARVYNGD